MKFTTLAPNFKAMSLLAVAYFTILQINARPLALADDDIVINEIHYNPCSSQGSDGNYEFVELFNQGSSSVNLSGWNFSVAMSFTFPSGTSLGAGEYLVVARNSSSYSGNAYQVFQWSGGLSNNSERIRLRNSSGTIIDEVIYDDNNGWPDADGNCNSLELVDSDTNNGTSDSWAASTVSNGTPGAQNSTTIVSGCTDPIASNYNSNANQDDESCIYPSPSASFSYTVVSSGCGKTSIQFTNTSSGANTYAWSFGSAYPSTIESNPLLEFNGGETISVSLTASNPDNSDISTQSISITLNNAGTPVTMELQPDCFGSELGWELSNDENVSIDSESTGSFSDDDEAALIVRNFCLIEDCYEIKLTDSYSDGFHGTIHSGCSLNGSLKIEGPNDLVLYEYTGALDWGAALTGTFCTIKGCTDVLADNYSSSATVDDGTCNYSNATAAFTYSIVSNGCGFADIQFTNTSSGASSVQWSFSYDGMSSSETNPLIRVPSGISLEVELTASNDENSDQTSSTIVVPSTYGQNNITFTFQSDCWGSELGWSIKDASDNIIASLDIGEYDDEENPDPIDYQLCLSDACYTVTLNDVYGDGFTGGTDYSSCSTDGSYSFKDEEGNVLASYSGAFEESLSNEHCFDQTYVWKGATSSDWGTASNWEGGTVPNSSKSVMIDTQSNNPSLDEAVTIQSLIINTGSALSMENSSAVLNVKKHFINNGDFDNENGIVQMNGSDLQLISGSSVSKFYRLKINTNDTVRLTQNIALWGALQMEAGTLDLEERDLSLLSNANNTGSIGEIKSGASIEGDEISYNRFFSAGQGNWRMLCSPINDATFQQWADDFPTTGFPGSDYPNYPSSANPWANIRKYDETHINGDEADRNFGFEAIGNVTDTIGTEKGYFVYFDPNPTTIDMQGEFNKGSQTLALDYSSSEMGGVHDGWNLVANPYPSAIDWEASGLSKTGVNNAIYAFNPATGLYASYVNGIGVGGFDGLIASGQAFWVKTNANNPNLTIEESAKSNLQGVHLRSTNFSTNATVRIQMEGSNTLDEVVLAFNDESSSAYDPDLDAFKFYPSNPATPSLALIPDTLSQEPYSIAVNPFPAEELWVPLEVKKGGQTDLMLINAMVDSEDDLCLYLEDLELEQTVPFNHGDVYPFVMSDSSPAQRFVIHMAPPLDLSVLNESCPEAENGQIIAQGFGQAPWDFVWRDEMGSVLKESTALSTADVVEGLAPGFYEVSVTGSNALCASSSAVVQVETADESNIQHSFETASCNSIESAQVVLNMNAPYEWDLSLFNTEGALLEEKIAQQDSSSFEALSGGLYQIIAENNCGQSIEFNNIDLRDPNAIQGSFSEVPEQVWVSENVPLEALCSNCSQISWDFGDGNLSSDLNNPSHEFTTAGSYEIQVLLENEFCSEQLIQTIEVIDRPSDELSGPGASSFSANEEANNKLVDSDEKPQFELDLNAENLQLKSLEMLEDETSVRVLSIGGQLLFETQLLSQEMMHINLNTSEFAPGIYFIEAKNNQEVLYTEKFVIQ